MEGSGWIGRSEGFDGGIAGERAEANPRRTEGEKVSREAQGKPRWMGVVVGVEIGGGSWRGREEGKQTSRGCWVGPKQSLSSGGREWWAEGRGQH